MTKQAPEGLPADLTFAPDGHLTDVCLSCVSDGEIGLVPPAALAHLDACEPCARRLGEAALLSVAAGAALREAALAPAPVVAPVVPVVAAPVSPRRTRRPMPIAAIAVASLVAALTAAPALVEAAREIPRAVSGMVGLLLLSLRVGSALLRASSSGSAPLLVKGVSTVVFLIVGLQVARVRSRARSWQGGVQ
jgi:hypothetical protein